MVRPNPFQNSRYCENGIEINNNLINGPGVVGGGVVPTSPTVPTLPGDLDFGIFNSPTVDSSTPPLAVPLATNVQLVGTAITHTPGEAAINLVEPGTYTISYNAEAAPLTVGGPVGLLLRQDQVDLVESADTGVGATFLSGAATVAVTTVPAVITLSSSQASTLTDVNVTVIKTA
ncbi:hypothetical protein [Geomicrobium sp. JCM 19038]|uniref:hypothetical protein n=1 Tax=Geomicrobium sp. JCM 19038 TaxID=1460635 RepID=UPI00045F29B7|nr:hypothetical protein [Geomicrobium sp. JCM 19038]GAK07836.1 hypothetical protein JCM19038_1582 [Geomicrobium sp. JCM 19038]